MHLRFFSWWLAGVLLASVSLRAQAPAATPPAVVGGAELILVAKVTGTVTMTVNGATTPLAVDSKVPQTAKVNTAVNSSVVLVFSNGATAQLGAETEMIIEEYLQDPFSTTVNMATITDEPSVSKTKLKLNRGELVGKVAHLKHDKGSTFVVETPVGAAGIRGTTFRIVFRPNGTGQAFFQLSTVEGQVAFGAPGSNGGTTPEAGGTPAATPGGTVTGQGTAGVAVPQGQEIAITVDVTVNAQGQQVVTVLTPVTSTANISTAVAAQVNTVAAEIAVATQQTAFTPAPSTSTGSGTSGAGSTGGSTTGGTTTGGTTTGGTTTGSTTTTDKTAPITGKDFTGTVTQKNSSLTPGDGKGG